MTDPRPLVIYHDQCNDGLTAAWAVKEHFLQKRQQVELFPARYNQPPPDVTGRDVVIVDFSYKRPVLLEMLKTAKSIEIYDHHESAEADLKDLKHENLHVEFDLERSGAGIAWDHFHEDDETCSLPRPWFVDYVEDNDLWRHRLTGCKEVIEYIRSWPTSQHFQMFDHWYAEQYLQDRLDSLADAQRIGTGILRAKQVMVQQSLTFSQKVEMSIPLPSGHRRAEVMACNVPFFLSSEVAGALATKAHGEGLVGIGITYYRRDDGRWNLSFRSDRAGDDYPVNKLASEFGGGGNRNAAGADVTILPWDPQWCNICYQDTTGMAREANNGCPLCGWPPATKHDRFPTEPSVPRGV